MSFELEKRSQNGSPHGLQEAKEQPRLVSTLPGSPDSEAALMKTRALGGIQSQPPASQQVLSR